ncbi:CTTNBP2 N-terminal-like protein isoform X1 [Centruroides vittatus]|uniref:CTTNBP2 N-terminal-like protein isoform X1 n=1 Tax=Centruroides vittatus TaxID=120091 RepID=UPI00350EE04D
MASRTIPSKSPSSSTCSFEPLDKISSNTLKRHPKTELNKNDLLQLLSVLEGELQAREIVIAVLKAEQIKQLLYPCKRTNASTDPWAALHRDVFGAFDAILDEATVKTLYNMQLQQLENFILQQRKAQEKLQEQLRSGEERFEKLVVELEDEKRKHAQDTAQGDDVTYMLEKERERLHQEVEFERQQNRKLEKDIKRLNESIEEERNRQKQIVLLLLAERKRLILRLLEERQRNEELTELLSDEKGRIADMVEGLEEESKKSLQMEAEMERQLIEFDSEREHYKDQVTTAEMKNQELTFEIEKLQEEMEILRKQMQGFGERTVVSSSPMHLGEGVRSTVVTMVSTPPAIRVIPTVSPAVSPPRGVARAVSPKIGPAPATPMKPPGLVPQIPMKAATPINSPPKPLINAPVSATVVSTASGQNVTTLTSPQNPALKGTAKKSSPVLPPRSVSPVSSDVSAENIQPSSTTNIVQNLVYAVAASEQQAVANDSNQTGPRPAGTKIFTTSQGGKVMVHLSGSAPILATKKTPPIGRGTPPPIPPNKPVLTSQLKKDAKPPVPPRNDNASESTLEQKIQKPLISGTRFGVAITKVATPEVTSGIAQIPGTPVSTDEDHKTGTQVGENADIRYFNETKTKTCIKNVSNTENFVGVDVFGQELVDFQELLVSMVSIKSDDDQCNIQEET